MRLALQTAALTLLLAVSVSGQPQPDAQSFDSNGVQIGYVDRGQGEPVVLLHGFGDTLRRWEATVIPRLMALGFRVIAYDARGHGSSGKPDNPAQYGQEDVNDVVRLLDYLSIDRVHIVGYSRGASIAGRLVAQQPRRVRSVVFGGWGVDNPIETMDPSDCAATADAIEQGKPPVLLLRALGLPLPPAAATTGQMQSPEVRRALAVAFSAECLTRRRVTVEELAAAGVPALAIVGELDGVAPSVKAMAPHMPTLEVIVISGATHFTALGNPAFIDAVSKFLSQNRGAPR